LGAGGFARQISLDVIAAMVFDEMTN